MSTYRTTEAGPTWQPLGTSDYGAIGFTTVVDVAAALLVVHVVWNAGWPPYMAATPQIIVFSGLAAILATFGVSLRYGMWGADGEKLGCTTVSCLVWLGLGALFTTAFVRVYRYHDVLVKQSGVMWPIVFQLVGFMVPFTLAPAFEASPDLATFDSNSLECRSESRVPEFFAFGAMGVLAFTSVVMAFRLRVARVQAPHEFVSAVITSFTLLAAAIALPVVHSEAESDREGRRVAMLVITALTSVGVVASPVFHPLKSFIFDEEKLENSGNYFLGEWRSKQKAQYMRVQSCKFQEAASSDREIEGFPAMAECFRVIMAREEIESYPLLQASTMRILDAYFRKGAPSAAAMPLSDSCRSSTLKFRASSAFIFDRARGEMLEKMGVGKVVLPDDECREVVRSHSSATTGASSQSPDSRKGHMDSSDGSPASRVAAYAKNADARTSPLPPPSRASSTTSSLNYSTDSDDQTESPQGLSPLHQPPSSPFNRHGAEDRNTNAAAAAVTTQEEEVEEEEPMSPKLDYRGDRAVDPNRNKKKTVDTSSGGGRKNPILSFFAKMGGGAAARQATVQEGGADPVNEAPPPVVHMGDDDDDGLDDDDVYGGAMDQGQAIKTLGKSGGGGTGVQTVAKVVDVHAAFGLDRKDDDEDDDEEAGRYRSTGFLGAIKKKKKRNPNQASISSAAGIGGYGSVLSSGSSSPGSSNDLAEAARAIPKPLFGDASRAVGRQNTRGSILKKGSARSGFKSVTSASAAAEASSAFAGKAGGGGGGGGGGDDDDDDDDGDDNVEASGSSRRNSAGPRGHSLDLSDAYGLDLVDEGGAPADEDPSPPPKTATVNPLFKAGGAGGGGRVKAVARAFDVEAQAQAVSAGVVVVDSNKIGLPGRTARKKHGGKRKSGSSRRLSSTGSALDVFTIAEGGEGEEDDDDDEGGGSGGGGEGSDQNV